MPFGKEFLGERVFLGRSDRVGEDHAGFDGGNDGHDRCDDHEREQHLEQEVNLVTPPPRNPRRSGR